jgi:hypothetical protein
MSHKIILTVIGLTILGASAFAVGSSIQRQTNQTGAVTKLSFGNPDLSDTRTSLPAIRPIAISPNRLLVPAGDVLYMLDANKRIVWQYSVEPNIFYDVAAEPRGTIYLAISDGLFKVLDLNGKEVWGNFMNGSAQYSQIAPYKNGLLVVVDMWGYRQKGSTSEDHIEFWQNRKLTWRKDFPKESRLEIWGNKILSVKQTKEGKEIAEIR